jgi:hypothetical protein
MNGTTNRTTGYVHGVRGLLALLLSVLPLTVWSAIAADHTAAAIGEQQAIGLALNRFEAGKQAITVTNPRHRAVFDRNGVQFIPARGPAWHWQLTRLDGTQQVVPIRSAADTVDFARDGLIERYLIKANTIEQRFVLERPWPQGRDLVITGAIESKGRMKSTTQGWVWRDAAGVVSLGQVTVFDATGKVLPARMQVTDTRSTIQVAAADLAGAVYPVTIDPEIGSNDFRISNMGPDGDVNYEARLPKVAFNAIANEYLVVWYGDDNTAPLVEGEYEIFGQRIDAVTGARLGANFRISDMGPDGNTSFAAGQPDVVWNATANEYLVVWQGDDDTAPLVDNENEIFGQRLDGATGAEIGANDFRISDMGPDGNTSFGASSPVVAWNATANEYLVVWQGDDDTAPLVDNEREVFGQRLDAAGLELGANDFRLSDMGPDGDVNYGAYDPAVAFNATANEYLVVWYGDDNTAPLVDGEYEIFGQRLTAAGGAIGTNDFRLSDMGPDGDTGYFAFNPAVAFNATADEYLVVWYGTDNTAPLVANENEIFGQRLDGTGGELGANDFRISDMGPNGNSNYSAYDPVVAWNAIANEYLVVWHGDDNTAPLVNGEGEIFGQRLDAAGGETGTNDFRLSDMGPDGDANFYAADAAVAWRSMTNEYLVVWYGDDDTGALVDDENEIFGQLYRLFSSIPLAGGGGGGGCTLNPAATRHDPVIPLLMLIAAGCLLRRRVRRQASLGSTACG